MARNGWNLEIGIWVIDSVSNCIIDLWEIDPRELIGMISFLLWLQVGSL